MRTLYALRLVPASLVLALAACTAVEDPATLASAVKKDPCLTAEAVELGEAMVTLAGDSTSGANKPELCASSGGPIHRPVYYTFTVSAASLLYVDTLGTGFDTVVGLLAGGCGARASACADDGCGTPQTQLVEAVAPGTYHLAIGGKSAEDRGPFVLHAQLAAVPPVPASGLASIEIPRGEFELVGTVLPGSGGPTRMGSCGLAFGMAWYWYAACPGDENVLEASTANAGTAFDAALYWFDVDDGEKVCCDEPPNDGLEACFGAGMDQFPGQAEILVEDEPDDVGLHVLEIGSPWTPHNAGGAFHVVGSRL